jgi:hypothetical protein
MTSWKARLLMVFTMLALILAVSVPGMADVEVECDAEDGGTCEETVSYESELCYPFCGLEWWPW